MGKTFELISLCASYIDTNNRLISLNHMLASIDHQTLQIKLLLSICCTEATKDDCIKQINEWTNDYKWLTVYNHDTSRMSQFEHYAFLQQYISTSTWCLFTDDDDVWHPDRALSYHLAIDQSLHTSATHDIIVCIGGRMCVDKVQIEPQEYFEFGVKGNSFKTFFGLLPKTYLSFRGCDLIFRNYLRCFPCITFSTDRPWLYKHLVDPSRYSNWSYIDEAADAWNIFASNADVRIWHFWRKWLIDKVPIRPDFYICVLSF